MKKGAGDSVSSAAPFAARFPSRGLAGWRWGLRGFRAVPDALERPARFELRCLRLGRPRVHLALGR